MQIRYTEADWTVTLLNQAVVAELEAMPADIRARFNRIVTLIQAHGLELIQAHGLERNAGAARQAPEESVMGDAYDRT